ncbi:MAG: hypothetical protein B7Z66_05125 [Chromatiales bacterium 21-64-14]|nr:MAG: hypothetical protein B7Z66_05125 [Chromatiales bacterium 21-64-14]HQU16485.1 MFS transporter [Gammaproteobacteria bacterium]
MSGGGETYLSAFALLLKASTEQIALLAALPPLLGSFAQLLSAWLGRRIPRRKTLILAGAGLQALTWLPLALLPLLFRNHAVMILIGCVTVYYMCGNLIAPQWTSLMGDLVPERKRGRYFGRRTRYATVMAFLALVSAGLVLDGFDRAGSTVTGYLLVFAAAAVARLVSIYHLARMHEPPRHPMVQELVAGGWLKRARKSSFLRFSLFVFLMQFAVSIASPFFTVYMLRDLHFSYLQFMANTATAVVVQILTLNTWGRISDAFGNRLILALTGSLIPFLPALWLVSTSFWYLIAVQILAGLSWAGYSLSSGNFLYDLVPSPKRTTYLAFHNTLVNVGLFLGAMLGAWLASALPTRFTVAGHEIRWISVLYGVFLVSTLVRATVAIAFLPRLREVRTVRAMSLPTLVFRVMRFHALSGLMFDVVTMFRHPPPKPPGDTPGRAGAASPPSAPQQPPLTARR